MCYDITVSKLYNQFRVRLKNTLANSVAIRFCSRFINWNNNFCYLPANEAAFSIIFLSDYPLKSLSIRINKITTAGKHQTFVQMFEPSLYKVWWKMKIIMLSVYVKSPSAVGLL